jgi:tetratricopeptide (TPR) repeat protein
MCRRAIEMAPDFAFAHFGVGATTFYVWLFWGGHAGDVAETVPASAARMAELEPNDAETIRLLCLLSLMRGDIKTAIKRADEAIRLNPNDVDLTTTRGVCLMFDGAFEAAERHFEAVVALHSQTPQAADITRAFLGLAQFAEGDVEAAIGTAGAIDGFEMGRDLVLAACCADRGDRERALGHARALTLRYPDLAVGDVGACRMFREERHRRRLTDALRMAGLPG